MILRNGRAQDDGDEERSPSQTRLRCTAGEERGDG